jgi:hypothetical protein
MEDRIPDWRAETNTTLEGAMSNRSPYVRIEQEVLPGFRHRLDRARSVEEIRVCFAQEVRALLTRVCATDLHMGCDEIRLDPGGNPPYQLSLRILTQQPVAASWIGSDLPEVIGRIAEAARHRHVHLQQHPPGTSVRVKC